MFTEQANVVFREQLGMVAHVVFSHGGLAFLAFLGMMSGRCIFPGGMVGIFWCAHRRFVLYRPGI